MRPEIVLKEKVKEEEDGEQCAWVIGLGNKSNLSPPIKAISVPSTTLMMFTS
jgi:hypothetical protein